MKYKNTPDFNHASQEKIGVLITNLGTPDEPTKPALKRYLKEFLSDPRVVEFPRALWWMVLNGVILQIRPKRSAQAYKTVWTEQGSPLLTITLAQLAALQKEFGPDVSVYAAMRYGNPSLSSVVEKMLADGVRKLLVVPLYPQYCAATTASTFDALAQDFTQRRWLPELRFISHYHDYSPYITACAGAIKEHWRQHGRAERLVLSFHGIPKRYLLKGDPYFCECHKTSRLIAQALGLSEGEYKMTFQSRFGREEWLKPYTDETLKQLAADGTKSVQVFCPGFAADCLETIEEIDVENRQYFIEAGGEKFEYIPALNDAPHHISALAQLIRDNLGGWSCDNSERTLQASLAGKLGAES
ncbi:ferrochelatase [Halioxenophilus aromaticivorans]|uniref:Ferrochelatase n=1 Tax=Halioxenophilus aromaticivorans TaxID=1306992 RepID=A0AAV3TX53_9ALTE